MTKTTTNVEKGNLSKDKIDEFTAVRAKTDMDMVFIVNLHLKETVSAEAAEAFLSNPMIMSVADATTGVQRIVVNRYFVNKLLIFRSQNEVPIIDVMPLLVNDGPIEDWFTLFKLFIAPFLKNNSIV